MIMPNKIIKPVDCLFCISAYVVDEAKNKSMTIDDIYKKINQTYPKPISIETLLLCLNYLFIIGKLENNDEVIKIKL